MKLERCTLDYIGSDPEPYRATEIPRGTESIQLWTNDGYDGTEIHVRFVDAQGKEIKPHTLSRR